MFEVEEIGDSFRVREDIHRYWTIYFDTYNLSEKKEEKVRKLAQYCCDVLNEGD